MTDKVIQAIEKSIEKWDSIIEGNTIDKGQDNCALCQMFLVNTNSCNGCPIALFTKHNGCAQTPYEDFVEHWCIVVRKLVPSELIKDKEYVRLAKLERKFLKEVLKWYKKQ